VALCAKRPDEDPGVTLLADVRTVFEALGFDRIASLALVDTLRGAPDAKRAWTERNMIEDITAGLDAVKVPVSIVIGDRDQVEHEPALRKTFARFLPQATFRVLQGIGHLSPLEAPGALADACTTFVKTL
jgi:pimeloyl-ACP methyl ester carboxylesterase